MPASPLVLVADDDRDVRALVRATLTREGFDVAEAANGPDALREVTRRAPALVVLDVTMPGMGGFEVLAQIRQRSAVPVIMLTGRGDEGDRIRGLELGADDYVVKPCSPRELAARVRTVLRRSRPAGDRDRLEFPGLTVDCTTREVVASGRPVELTAREFDLLVFLARSPRQVFSRARLLERVWDSSAEWQDPATVTEHVRRVRAKLRAAGGRDWIRTVRGVGYALEP